MIPRKYDVDVFDPSLLRAESVRVTAYTADDAVTQVRVAKPCVAINGVGPAPCEFDARLYCSVHESYHKDEL